jgi:hypothetical protein
MGRVLRHPSHLPSCSDLRCHNREVLLALWPAWGEREGGQNRDSVGEGNGGEREKNGSHTVKQKTLRTPETGQKARRLVTSL